MKGVVFREIREKWLHHIFEIFSTADGAEQNNNNNDNKLKHSIIYADLKEMLRIANIIENNFNEEYSLISKQEFDNLYEECAEV